MHMPNVHQVAERVRLGRPMRHADPMVVFYVLAESVFWAGCALWFGLSLSRLATGVKTQARLRALKSMPDAFTDEERTRLIHKTKTRLLGPL